MSERVLESEMNKKNCMHESYLQGNTGDSVVFSAVPGMWAYSFSKKDSITDAFLGKLFYRTSFLQNTDARLFLISCKNFNVSLALSVINQFSHS